MRKLTNCPVCQKEVSINATSCPNCGEPLKTVVIKETIEVKEGIGFWGVVFAVVLAIIIMSFC